MDNSFNKIYVNEDNVDLTLEPHDTENYHEYNITVIQEHGKCPVNICLKPKKDSLSKLNVRLFTENKASVDCVCKLIVEKDAGGIDTDMQIRSWPFDESRIQARPEMFVENSDIKAAHGNAIGTLSEDDRYYLHSKGITNYKDLVKESLYEE